MAHSERQHYHLHILTYALCLHLSLSYRHTWTSTWQSIRLHVDTRHASVFTISSQPININKIHKQTNTCSSSGCSMCDIMPFICVWEWHYTLGVCVFVFHIWAKQHLQITANICFKSVRFSVTDSILDYYPVLSWFCKPHPSGAPSVQQQTLRFSCRQSWDLVCCVSHLLCWGQGWRWSWLHRQSLQQTAGPCPC